MENKSISSRFREAMRFFGSVKGDLANITAPPFFLAPTSVVEVGHCWAERPDVFVAPALEASAEKRSLLVLRLVLLAMKSQFYIAATPEIGIRKPLNAFLGELFLASWTDTESKATTELVAEQVSHHPPVTAMFIASREHGIRADGYARVGMVFRGFAVNVRQQGSSILHIDRYDEDYLIPLPDVTVHGFLGGYVYPDITGTYHVVSSSGYVSEICFTGAGVFRGKKNSFKARIYHKDDPSKTSVYELEGVWSEGWTVKDQTGEILETVDLNAPDWEPPPADVPPITEQDPWESRRAWSKVLDAIRRGNFRDTVQEKTKIEQAQRRMRAAETKPWQPLFFRSTPGEEHTVFHNLVESSGTDSWSLDDDRTKGVWRVDDEKVAAGVASLQRPFRHNTTPLG